MAIDYEKVNWNTNSYVNPNNMNHMDEGIKQACDGVDNSVKKGSANTENVGWSGSNYPYMTVGGERKRLELHSEYSQKFAWVNHDINNQGTCNANEVVFLGWRANPYGVDVNATHKMYLEDFPNKPSNFTIDNCKIMYATTECSSDWGVVGKTALAMYNQDGVFAFGRIHSTNQYYTVKALLMRTDI